MAAPITGVPAQYSYDLALSFAGEQRPHALRLAELLHAAHYRVFYDEWEAYKYLGQSLTIRLTAIYQDESRYCVILASDAYVEREWPRHELQCALSRHVEGRSGYILPIRFDDTPLPGLPRDTAYLDARKKSIEYIADELKKRLGAPPGPAPAPVRALEDPWLHVAPAGYIAIVVVKGGQQGAVLNFRCHLSNRAEAPAALRHLEARLTDPSGSSVGLSWNVFYDQTGLLQHDPTPAQPVSLQGGESRLIGVQFARSPLQNRFRWRAGSYEIRFFGLVDRGRIAEHFDLGASFTIRLQERDIHQIDGWSTAGDAVWAEVNDPHNAVGIPVLAENISSRFGG